MSFLGRQAVKYAYRKIAYSLKDYLIDPASVKVGEKNSVFLLTKSSKIEGSILIGLVILGDFEEELVPVIEIDLTVGIGTGHLLALEQYRETKFKPDNLRIIDFAYQNHEYKYRDVGGFGSTLGMGIYQEKYMRKEIKKTANVKGMDWGEEFNKMIPKIKAKKYDGTPVVKYYEKMIKENDWVIPIEAVRIWQYIKFYPGQEVDELANELSQAFQSNNAEAIKKVSRRIESNIYEEDKNRRKKHRK